MTRLETYLKRWGVMASALADRAGMSRGHLHRLRMGKSDPTRRAMVAITDAASAIQHRPVYMVELFELAPSDEAVYVAPTGRPGE